MKRLATLVFAGLMLVDGPAFATDVAPTSPAGRRADVVIPFQEANRAIFIRVTVAGHPLWFVLDTGDKYAIIDLGVARSLGLELGSPVPLGGAGAATVTGAMVKSGSFEVAGLDGFSQPLFIAAPLGDLAKAEGHEFSGVIGADFISQFVVDIDYVRRTLTLHDRAAYRDPTGGRVLPVSFDAAGHPQAPAEIVDAAGHTADGLFTLDIGSTGAVILNSPFAAKNRLPLPGQTTVPLQGGDGVGGQLEGEVGRLSAVKLGGFVIREPITVFAQSSAGAFASDASQGNIGGAILDRFNVTLDYARSRLILVPNARLAEPMDYDMSGLSVSASGPTLQTFTVDAVAPGTPAAAARVAVGDRLTDLNGRPAADYSLSDLRAALKHPGTVRLTIEHAGRPRTVRLRLKRMV